MLQYNAFKKLINVIKPGNNLFYEPPKKSSSEKYLRRTTMLTPANLSLTND